MSAKILGKGVHNRQHGVHFFGDFFENGTRGAAVPRCWNDNLGGSLSARRTPIISPECPPGRHQCYLQVFYLGETGGRTLDTNEFKKNRTLDTKDPKFSENSLDTNEFTITKSQSMKRRRRENCPKFALARVYP